MNYINHVLGKADFVLSRVLLSLAFFFLHIAVPYL